MQAKTKLTFQGGSPVEELLTVCEGEYRVHLYKCNRSQLLALGAAIARATAGSPLLETAPTRQSILDLVDREVRQADSLHLPEPAKVIINETANPALN